VSAADVERVDGDDVADDDRESVEDVGAVAAQRSEDEDEDETAVDVSVSLPLWVVSAGVTVGAALLEVSTAMTPPRPSSAATLAAAAALRARRAGCGRGRRGVASGITRSFARGPSHRPGRR
jgi:hypothetical protein